jgi:hypothetical protein
MFNIYLLTKYYTSGSNVSLSRVIRLKQIMHSAQGVEAVCYFNSTEMRHLWKLPSGQKVDIYLRFVEEVLSCIFIFSRALWMFRCSLTIQRLGTLCYSSVTTVTISVVHTTVRLVLLMLKLALASLTSGGRSVGIVRLRTTSHGV